MSYYNNCNLQILVDTAMHQDYHNYESYRNQFNSRSSTFNDCLNQITSTHVINMTPDLNVEYTAVEEDLYNRIQINVLGEVRVQNNEKISPKSNKKSRKKSKTSKEEDSPSNVNTAALSINSLTHLNLEDIEIRGLLTLRTKCKIFNQIIKVFNFNDFDLLQTILFKYSSEKIVIYSNVLETHIEGYGTLLMLWILILECYPDGVIDICSINPVQLSKSSVSFTFNFSGTRITSHTVESLYTYAVSRLENGRLITPAALLDIITQSSLNIQKLSVPIRPFTLKKCRVILTYNSLGKITHFYYNMQL